MDEILIEEKKYVSSKRAAKMTGYAKDYIGQLCREGRVPARLIGRSWYVLEAAIQDHRFGNEGVESEKNVKDDTPKKQAFSSTWESPRYEASSEELLPSINRLKDENENQENEQAVSQRIQDSWKMWFDRFEPTEKTTEPAPSEEKMAEKIEENEEKLEEVEETKEKEEEQNINIPIHTVSQPFYNPPPEEFLPRQFETAQQQIPEVRRKRTHGSIMTIFQVVGAVAAIVTVSLAIAGSGYIDEYIVSNSQVSLIAGVELYNK
jgi:hypothetical protein